MRTLGELKELIACGKGELPCDWKLKNVKLVNVYSGEIYPTDIYIKGRRIVSIEPGIDLMAEHEQDCRGMYAVPGLIDSHMHFESTMLSPEALADVVVPKGTTTLMADLMEIANVAGEAGLREMLKSLDRMSCRMLIEVSSRVPTAPGLETTGAVLGAAEVDELMSWEESVSLGEMDSSKILLSKEDQYLKKICSALNRRKPANGHAIGRLGQELNIYASSGISDDHECVTEEEMIQRIRVGMKVFIREGSTERNVDALVKAVVEHKLDTEHLMFCTDDKHIGDIRREGHINYNVNRSIALGLDPMEAIRMATIRAAKHFRMEEEIGSITPGRLADIILCEDICDIQPAEVWFEGKLAARNGAMLVPTPVRTYPAWLKDTVKLKNPITAGSFRVEALQKAVGDRVKVRVIRLVPSQIINEEDQAELTVGENGIQPDLAQDVIKLSVVERYGKNGNVGNGFVKGFHLKKGAMAYSMSHDHHNIVVTGVSDTDMALAVNEVARLHGGLAVACDGRILASMELPIGGLMSEKSPDEVEKELDVLNKAAESLGCTVAAPFMALSFISLPTVPELGLTDKGLVDVIHHCLIPVIL
ncbi:adenine deaminase [Lacrimispora sp. 210928-DFI.3.58]|uniref:adenine deaminase n=1 Tax=Lacrimispora sp. 210928-DFI.3.58 TaxID=2883214 RepID=UPI001D092E9A|nr:adenine deaminase [Lacrimispora sp. 210928-DFI.3.58]MCB7318278.1 adenine deaminase [Lacrimispora sp. 210928-DFI.3.58]